MKRVIVIAALLASAVPAQARVGFGDPGQSFRDHKPGEILDLRGHLRVRGALYSNLDLDRGPSPSTGLELWPHGETPLDLTMGADTRVRLAPTLWWGDDVRVFLEVDLLDNLSFGATPRGTPFDGRTGIVAGTAFQDPVSAAAGAFRVRSAVGEVFTPIGLLSAGRAPVHFGLGIAANAGDDIDDDGGDRADRVAWVLPFFGHFLAAAADISASGPRGHNQVVGPNPFSPGTSQQALSVAMLRYRAPWEVEMHRAARGWLIDYGAALSTQFQLKDTPVFYQTLKSVPGSPGEEQVRRNYVAALGDFWLRLWWRDLRIEAEAVVSHVHIGNPSPYPGVTLRQQVTGNPFGGVAVVEWLPLRGRFGILGETGIASPDPAPGFPQGEATAFVGTRGGDVFGPQIDGVRDTRFDSFRFHPMYRVDLIMWRTLLAGVSEAAYVRGKLSTSPVDGMRFEASAIYSHGLSARSTPGGVNPLGFEVDTAMVLAMGAFSLRVDAGVLLPMGGLGRRGGVTARSAEMVLVRLGYAR